MSTAWWLRASLSMAVLAAAAAVPASAQKTSSARTGGGGLTLAQIADLRLPTITAGQTVRGSLSRTDVIRDDGTYADGFAYTGRAGERITVTLRSGDFDSWVVVDDPNGPMTEYDDDGAGGNDSRLSVTLPHDGRYVILANAVSSSAAGNYTLTLSTETAAPGRTTPGTQRQASLSDIEKMDFPAIIAGQTITGSLSRTDVVRDDDSFADGFIYNGKTGETLTITMRSGEVDSWVVLDDPNGSLSEHDDDSAGGNDARLTVTLPHDGRYIILANSVQPGAAGNYSLSITSQSGGGIRPNTRKMTLEQLEATDFPFITVGQSITGSLDASDIIRDDDNSYADGFSYNGRAGERITITMRSRDMDAWLVMDEPNGDFYEFDDDTAGGTDAQLTVTLPRTGRYVILANTVSAGTTGSYTISVAQAR